MRKVNIPMKKILFIGVGTALMFAMSGVGSAQADTTSPPHNITKLGTADGNTQISTLGAGACAGCHRVHTAKAEKLLKQDQATLCASCHDGSGSSLDTVDGIQAGTPSIGLRGGGFGYAVIGSGAAQVSVSGTTKTRTIPVLTGGPAPVTSRHQINGTAGTMWGSTDNATDALGKTAVVLECASCHNPHGNGNYRMLKPLPAGGTGNDGATGINIPDQPTKNYVTTNYWDVQAPGVPATLNGAALPNIPSSKNPAGTPVTDGYLGNIAAWCTTCHTRYLGTSTTSNTKTADPTYTYKHRSDEGASGKPNCIQCHVSHGSNASMTGYADGNSPKGVTNPDGTVTANLTYTNLQGNTATAGANSDLLRVDNRGTCLMCHTM